MTYTATALGRRLGAKPKDVLRRWRADVGVAIAIRRARMAQRCLPPLGRRSGFVAFGEFGEGAGDLQAAQGALGDYAAQADELGEQTAASEQGVVEARPGPVVPLVVGGPGIPFRDIRLNSQGLT